MTLALTASWGLPTFSSTGHRNLSTFSSSCFEVEDRAHLSSTSSRSPEVGRGKGGGEWSELSHVPLTKIQQALYQAPSPCQSVSRGKKAPKRERKKTDARSNQIGIQRERKKEKEGKRRERKKKRRKRRRKGSRLGSLLFPLDITSLIGRSSELSSELS